MKVLKSLLVLVIILVVVGVLIPADFRTAHISYSYGKFLEFTKKQGKAVNSYKTAAEAMPDTVKFIRAYVRTLNDLGEDASSKDQFEQAYNLAHRWIEDHNTHPDVWQMYVEQARAQWGLEKKSGAKVSIDKAVDLMPDDYDALVYKGIIYRDLHPNNRNKLDRAARIFEHAISVRNNTRTYWAEYELAVAWWMLNDETRALNAIEQALSQYPPRWLKEKAERLKTEIQSSGRSER